MCPPVANVKIKKKEERSGRKVNKGKKCKVKRRRDEEGEGGER
jgi:hypothetical protein